MEFFWFLDYLFIWWSFSRHIDFAKKFRIPSFHWFHTRLVHQLFWLHLKKRKIQSGVKFPKPNNSIKPFVKWKKLHKLSVQAVCPMINLQFATEHHLLNNIVGGQTLGSVTTDLGCNHMNLFRKFNVFEVIYDLDKIWRQSYSNRQYFKL